MLACSHMPRQPWSLLLLLALCRAACVLQITEAKWVRSPPPPDFVMRDFGPPVNTAVPSEVPIRSEYRTVVASV